LAGTELLPTADLLAEKAVESGVEGLALISADEQSLLEVPKLKAHLRDKFPKIHVVGTAGIHPHDSEKMSEGLWQQVVKLSEQAEAIGETGLDYFYDYSDRSVQKEAFDKHIQLACQQKKPLVIHCRQASDDIYTFLNRSEIRNHPRPGILHCFTEDTEFAKKIFDLGLFISFSGIISFKNADSLREVVRYVPIDKVLVETDSPWLAPLPHRGKRNQPSYVVDVFKFYCSLRSEPEDVIQKQLWENSLKIYGIN